MSRENTNFDTTKENSNILGGLDELLRSDKLPFPSAPASEDIEKQLSIINGSIHALRQENNIAFEKLCEGVASKLDISADDVKDLLIKGSIGKYLNKLKYGSLLHGGTILAGFGAGVTSFIFAELGFASVLPPISSEMAKNILYTIAAGIPIGASLFSKWKGKLASSRLETMKIAKKIMKDEQSVRELLSATAGDDDVAIEQLINKHKDSKTVKTVISMLESMIGAALGMIISGAVAKSGIMIVAGDLLWHHDVSDLKLGLEQIIEIWKPLFK